MTTTTHKTLRGPRGALILSKGTVGNPLRAPERTLENLPTLIDRAVFPGLQGGPHMNKVMSIAVALAEAAKPEFAEYAQQVLRNSKALASELMERGCRLITNGSDNHMMVIDTVSSFGKNGQEAQVQLEAAGITLNKNAIPDDPLPPFKPSGVRLGTPAATSRGLREAHMTQVADWIVRVCRDEEDPAQIKAEVLELCLAHPIPSGPVERAG